MKEPAQPQSRLSQWTHPHSMESLSGNSSPLEPNLGKHGRCTKEFGDKDHPAVVVWSRSEASDLFFFFPASSSPVTYFENVPSVCQVPTWAHLVSPTSWRTLTAPTT